VTVQAGVISRDLNQALDKERCCIPTPNISGVGYLPFVLGGGMSLLAGISGTATDAIVSAKVVTATRGLVTASKTENADLFWALKGAGQFFGVVTELKMKFYPWSQDIISWACVFSAAQVKEVGAVLEQVINVSGIGRSPGFVAVLESPVPLQVSRLGPYQP
jgi:FAD/FMN-containing dehydrogenase